MGEQVATGLFSCWQVFLSRIEEELGKDTVDKWVRTLIIKQGPHQKLIVEARDSFQALWFEEHLRPRLSSFVNPLGEPIHVSLQTAGKKNKQKERIAKTPSSNALFEFSELDSTYTFEEFISQDDTEIVVRLLKEICSYLTAERLKQLTPLTERHEDLKVPPPNPVYLCGPSGSGKTHLLTATAQRLKLAGLSVIMARSDVFTEHVIKSIRAGEMAAFRNLWRTVDVLIVDDVHLFSRKNTTQEEFFHTFNSLHMAGKCIILSANCLPQQLQHIEPRLVSRFEWGVVLPLSTLPRKSYTTLLERKAALLKFHISQKVIGAIAERFPSTPKACMQALEALILRSNMAKNKSTSHSSAMTIASVNNILSDLIEKEQELTLTPEKIISLTAETYGIKREDLIGKQQNREFVAPRQVAMYLIRKHLRIPFIKLGDIFEKNHSTVMSSIRQVEKLIPDPSSDTGSRIASIEIRLF